MNENADARTVIGRIHSSPTRAVIAVSGGGANAIAWLLAAPGASRTVLEAIVPYGAASMTEWIGVEPAQSTSVETAQAMAVASYRRALHLREDGARVVGLGGTAALVTDRPKRGAHRCHIAWHDGATGAAHSLVLAKGERDRDGEEQVVSRLVLVALAEACGFDAALPVGLLPAELIEVSRDDR